MDPHRSKGFGVQIASLKGLESLKRMPFSTLDAGQQLVSKGDSCASPRADPNYAQHVVGPGDRMRHRAFRAFGHAEKRALMPLDCFCQAFQLLVRACHEVNYCQSSHVSQLLYAADVIFPIGINVFYCFNLLYLEALKPDFCEVLD